MKCPLCGKYLMFNTMGCTWRTHYCSTVVMMIDQYLPHYIYNEEFMRVIMRIPPYQIVTYPNFSLVEKYDGKGYSKKILNTRDLNIEPISPKPEKELLNRIQTLLVFS